MWDSSIQTACDRAKCHETLSGEEEEYVLMREDSITA